MMHEDPESRASVVNYDTKTQQVPFEEESQCETEE
jgi:hypothetical protein